MDKKLVIVESPAKAKTIAKILGTGFIVKSSVGHIRDLPERILGVDIEHDFAPKYVLSKGKIKVIAELKKAAKECDTIYLAPDPDREGEAIAWHLQEVLAAETKGKPIFRIQYNEITSRAVRAAIEQPGQINMSRVNAQQARRILDRIVGYQVSPILWRRLKKGLSAGRVQSVALRLVSEREKLIQAFKSDEYWVMGATVRRETAPLDLFNIKLVKVDSEKVSVASEAAAHALLADLEGCALRVCDIKIRETTRRPLPPFITSTLQQAASSFCGFSPYRTMGIAQKLYEGVDMGAGGLTGLITYMRTDSVNVARDAQVAARDIIINTYGANYYPESPNVYKSRASAQEAHEAIRPTDVSLTPEHLKGILEVPALRLYELIWKRFVASQMTAARIAQKSVTIEPVKVDLQHSYAFSVAASEILFDGFLKVMALDIRKKKTEDDDVDEEHDEVDQLPPLAVGDPLVLMDWVSERKETKPPARYSEASLIRALEANGVGRPSTYASILETLNARNYTSMEKRQLMPTALGLEVSEFLVSKLDQLFDVGFTAKMEESLDQVEEGVVEWTHMMANFYSQFSVWMEAAKEPPADVDKVSAVLALFSNVTAWLPEVQHGKRKYSDERFVASVRDQINKAEKAVSDKQLGALAKIAIRYGQQIPEVTQTLSKLGFDAVLAKDQAAPSSEATAQRFEILQNLQFSDNQTSFIESLKQQAERGNKLSDRQCAALDRIIVQNAAQIKDFEVVKKRLGLIMDAVDLVPDVESPILLELLNQVTQWAEPVKRGKLTFDDQVFFKSLSDQYSVKKSLSPRQRSAMKRMAFRYKSQMASFDSYAEQLGMNKKRGEDKA